MQLFNTLINIPRLLACSLLQFRTKRAPFRAHQLDGKVAIITGGNSGIGFETAQSLALQGCEVIILCRNPAKATDAVEKINKKCGDTRSEGKCYALRLDLADLESVKHCVAELRSLFESKTIDYFFCNGGIMGQPYSRSPQGYEIHYATNHLGHFALVGGIVDLLRRDHSRVIVVTGDIAVIEDDASPDYEYSDDGINAYCRSKICNQAFGRLLQERYSELSVYVVHPGVIDSNLITMPEGSLLRQIEILLRPYFMINCEVGAQTSLLCALRDDYPRGSYVHNVFGLCNYHATAAHDGWSNEMWKTSERLCSHHKVHLHY
eukprot:gene16404-18608_t